MTDEKRQLLEEANAHYREGNPIMGDAEYDALEAELGLENANEIGEKHSPEMTIRHPFIMGSLSKIQVHRKKNGDIDWNSYLSSLRSYVGDKKVIITPKYDGCSFEAYFKDGECVSVSTRGDGFWGRDISKHIYNKIPEEYRHLRSEYTLRGEILVDRLSFAGKWSKEYINTRSFVAGVTGQDFDANDYNLLQKLNDLEIVIYDYRVKEYSGWVDKNWTDLPDSYVLPKEYFQTTVNTIDDLKFIYNEFSDYREECRFSLDGFVIKPVDRIQDIDSKRPKDCVAFKFLPMTATTFVDHIEWELGKTGEYFPIVYYNPVKMDGKTCIKASGHNYGTLVEKGIAPGAEIVISMAGDIIPYIYKVTHPIYATGLLGIPENTYPDGVHLYKAMTDEESRIEEFRNSCKTLDVPGLGDAQIQKLIDSIKAECQPDEFFGDQGKEFPFSIFELLPSAFEKHIGGKAGEKIGKAYKDIISNISLATIIETLNYRFCGKTVSKAIANSLVTGEADFEHLPTDGWIWSMDKETDKWKKFEAVMKMLGKDIEYFRTIHEQTAKADAHASTKTYIIMTGEPNDYDTKAAFLKAHPEYEETCSWTKVQIVFTNSMESNTGKMKKARERGVEIRLY